MARSPKATKKSKAKKQTYTVTLELMTPVQCTFEVEADSPAAAIEEALDLDWDDPQNVGPDGDTDTYCVEITDETGAAVAVPRQYRSDTVNKETN